MHVLGTVLNTFLLFWFYCGTHLLTSLIGQLLLLFVITHQGQDALAHQDTRMCNVTQQTLLGRTQTNRSWSKFDLHFGNDPQQIGICLHDVERIVGL